MTKQLRINFPDYTAEQQEADIRRFSDAAKKLNKPTLFVLKVNGEWAHLDLKLRYKFYEDMNLYQMFNEIKRTHPDHNLKYIINEGLENYLREMKAREQRHKQLKLDFRER